VLCYIKVIRTKLQGQIYRLLIATQLVIVISLFFSPVPFSFSQKERPKEEDERFKEEERLLKEEERPKHVLIAYDLSGSMARYWDSEKIERMNKYLLDLLFEGEDEVLPQDKIILKKETPLFGKGVPLLKPGDRVSFIGFGAPPIPDPILETTYDGSPSVKRELIKRMPKSRGEFTQAWTCLELLYWKASQVFRKYPLCQPNLRVLISDKCESRYPLSAEEQRCILTYKDLYRESIFLDIQVEPFHLEVTEIIPPVSRVEILHPKPWEFYTARRPLPLQVQVVKEGIVLKEEDWVVTAIITKADRPEETAKEIILHDDGEGEDEVSGDGVYSAAFLDKKGGQVNIRFGATKGPLMFESDQLKLLLTKPPMQPYWLYGLILLFIGLIVYHRLNILSFWVERSGFGGPPRKVELKRKGDILFLGKREEEPYIDLGLSKYSVVRQKHKEIALWREGKEEGEIVRWGRWFSPKDEEDLTLRFSLVIPKREMARPGIPKVPQAEGDFYKM